MPLCAQQKKIVILVACCIICLFHSILNASFCLSIILHHFVKIVYCYHLDFLLDLVSCWNFSPEMAHGKYSNMITSNEMSQWEECDEKWIEKPTPLTSDPSLDFAKNAKLISTVLNIFGKFRVISPYFHLWPLIISPRRSKKKHCYSEQRYNLF